MGADSNFRGGLGVDLNMLTSNKKDFQNLAHRLCTAYEYFILDEKISELEIAAPFQIRQSLVQSFVMEMAKIFDLSCTQPNLTIYVFLGSNYPWKSEHQGTITSLKNFRDKYLMHNDLDTTRGSSKFSKDFNLRPIEVKELLIEAYNQLQELEKNDRNLQLGIYTLEATENRITKQFDQWWTNHV